MSYILRERRSTGQPCGHGPVTHSISPYKTINYEWNMRLIRGLKGDRKFTEKPREFIQFYLILLNFSGIRGFRAHGHRPPGTPDAARAMVAPDANPGTATTPPQSLPGTGRLRFASPARRKTGRPHGARSLPRGEREPNYTRASEKPLPRKCGELRGQSRPMRGC